MPRPALVRSFVLTFLMGLALAGAVVVAAASSTPCRGAEDVRPAPASAGSTVSPRGVDLELRILNLRVEFPWLKDLPVTPGRRIVISWLESGAGRE
jgi:hypothetical protein